jgi:predicted nucleic acid-binding protein
MGEIVLTDTSPVIYLARIERLSWLKEIFGYVAMTSTVRRELLTARDMPGKVAIEAAVRDRTLREIEDEWTAPAFSSLDEGEESTIRVAVNLSRQEHHCHVLVDDKQARQVLQSLKSEKLDFAGTAAVVARAKRLGLTDSAAKELEKLRDVGFRLSGEIARSILDSVGEDPELWPPMTRPRILRAPRRRKR